jgi:hypothetical protein
MKMPVAKSAPMPLAIALSKFVWILIALTALVGALGAAHAATDAKQFFEQQERWSGGGQ